MGDDNHRLVCGNRLQALLQLLFRGVIHRTGRLVEQQDRRVHQKGAGDGDALPLPARERLAAFANQHVETVRVPVNELGQAGNLGRCDDGCIVGIRSTDGDIVAQRAVEQRRFLRNIADVAPQIGRVELAGIDTVDHHGALGRLVKAEQQFLQGRLAGSDAADDDHLFTGRNQAAKALERRQRRTWIAEFDIGKLDIAAQFRPMDETRVGGALDRLLHNLFQRDQRRLRVVVLHQQTDHLPERGHRPRRQHGAGDQTTHSQLPDADQVNPADDNGDIDQLLCLKRAIGRCRRQEAHLVVDAGDEGHRLFPLRLHDALGALRLDRFERRQAFDQRRIAQRPGPVGGLGQFVHFVLQNISVDDHDDDCQEHRQDKLPGDQRNHEDEEQRRRQIDEGCHRGRGDEIAHRLERTQVRGKGADRCWPSFHAHAEDAIHDLRRQLHVDPRTGEIDEIAA